MSSDALPVTAERLFRYLFEQASLGIAVEDLDGKILVVNPALCSMLGYRDDELPGMYCSEFANPEDSQDDWALFQQLCDGVIDHYTLEKHYKRKDGSPLWGRLNVSLLKQDIGESPLVFAFVENITESKQAEEALHQREKELTETQHLAGIGSWLWDARTDRMNWSNEISLRTGHDPNSPAPKLKELAGLFTPDTWDRLQRSVQEAVQTGTSYELDLELVRPLSGVKWATTRGEPLRAADGQVIGLRGTVQDITAHKRAEQKLAQSNDRFRLALEASKSVGWEWDPKSGQLSWFGDLQSMFGISSDSFVGRMDDFYRYVHPEDRPMVSRVVANARQNRKRYAAEFRVVRADGMVRWVAARGSFYYEANGDPVRMLGMATDITDRKRTEERLREYEKAVECSTDSITVINREYRYLIANRAFLKLRNMTSEQVVGHLVPEVLNKGVFEEVVKDKLDECFAGKIVKYELRYRYPEIGERDLLISYFPIEGSRGIDRVACIAQDITERKRAQDELRESEQRLHLAVQAGKMYVFEWDVVTDVIVRSKESVDILNWIDPEHDTGRDFHARIHPDDRALYTASEAKLTPENPAYQICFRTRGSDGSVTWLEDTGRAFFDAQRKMVRVIGIVGDITERKQTEEALQQKEEELREAQRLAGVGNWQWDAKKDRVIWSKEVYRLFGRDPNMPAPSFKEHPGLYTPESWERLQGAVREALQTGMPYELDMEIVTPALPTKWVIARGESLRDSDGQIIGLRGTIQDITERKHAEQSLRESEDKLRLLLDSTAEAIYGIDTEHRCTFCNSAFLRTLGYQHIDEVVGKNMHYLIHHTRPDGTPFPIEECRIHRVTRIREGAHADDELLWRADGTSFPVEYWSYPQRRGLEVVGAVVAFIDITERKLAAAALANVSRKLIEAQEQERTRIGRELHDDIGQRLALVAVEMQRMHDDPHTFAGVRRRLGGLRKRITEIAADTQSLSHELHSARLQYLGIAAAMKGFCREFGEKQKVKIDFKVHDLPSRLSADISLCLFRVLQEALHNAAKHSGGQRFEVRLWGIADEMHLTVNDFGRGFDREAAKTRQGIGLISMEERLKGVKGTLSVDSRPGRGTTIEARVPVSSDIDSMRAAG
jgi:PAS domain S-box-containing protein